MPQAKQMMSQLEIAQLKTEIDIRQQLADQQQHSMKLQSDLIRLYSDQVESRKVVN